MNLFNNSLTGSLPPQWGSNGAFPQLERLSLNYNHLSGSLPVEWGVPATFSILKLHNDSNFVAAAPFRSLQQLILWQNDITGAVPLEWTNNPHFLSARVVLNETLFVASKDSPDFAKGVCLDPPRYAAYRNWAIGLVQSDRCERILNVGVATRECLIPVANTSLDPCLMDSKTRVALIALWTCFGLVVLLLCLEQRATRLLDQRFTGFIKSREKAIAWIKNALSERHWVLLGMVATLIAF
jgi:hypothetical protein